MKIFILGTDEIALRLQEQNTSFIYDATFSSNYGINFNDNWDFPIYQTRWSRRGF